MFDKSILRNYVLEYLKKKPETGFSDSFIEEINEIAKKYDSFPTEDQCKKDGTDFVRYYKDKRFSPFDRMNVNEIVWDLIVERVITMGSNSSNMNWPHLRLTDFGKEIITDENAKYYDTYDYIKSLKLSIPNIDPVIEQYIGEGLNCYKRRLFFASCVMLGAAAEKAILLLLEKIGKAPKGEEKRQHIKNLLDRQSLPLIFKEIRSVIESLIKEKRIPYEIHQGSTEHILSLYEMIRVERNESIHPVVGKISKTKVLLFIKGLPASLEVVYKLISWFSTNKF